MRTTSLLLPFITAAFFVLPAATHAETNKTITTVAVPGEALEVVVAGNYAYVAQTHDGVTVMDVTTPSAPTIVRSVALSNTPTGLDITGSILYVAETSTVQLLSLTDGANPINVGPGYSQAGLTVTDVTSDGTYMYVLGSLSGQPVVEVVDITNPLSPVLKSTVNVHGTKSIVLAANYAYVVGGQTLDIINAYPILTIAGTYTDPKPDSAYYGVQVLGSNAYVNDPVNGLHAINIANPAAPSIAFESASVFPFTGYGVGLSISNGYVFLARNAGGVAIYDVISSTTPGFIDTYSGTASGGGGIAVANNVAYVTVGSAGVQLLDVSHPDVVPPVVTPIGNSTPVVAPGGKYVDPGVTTDSGTVVVTGKVDTSKVGRYVLTYTVTDRSGNVTKVTRTVIVGPAVDKLTLKNNTYILKVGKRNVTLRPFAGYSGAIVGRKLTVDTKTNPLYVFVATDALRVPQIVIYNASGNVTLKQSLSTISTKGLQVEIVSNPATLSVFYAVAPKANSLTATIFNFSKSGFKSLKTVTLAKTRATLVMKWLKGYTNEYILASIVKGKLDTPVVWRYNGSKKSFVKDTKFDTRALTWTKTTIGLK